MEGEYMRISAKKICSIAYDLTLTTVRARDADEVARCVQAMEFCLSAFNVSDEVTHWIQEQMITAYATRTIPSAYEMLLDLVQKVKI